MIDIDIYSQKRVFLFNPDLILYILNYITFNLILIFNLIPDAPKFFK